MWGIWEKIWVSSLFTAKFSFASCLCFYNCVAESFVVVVSPASSCVPSLVCALLSDASQIPTSQGHYRTKPRFFCSASLC